jgi:hypothetical protein
MDQSVYLHLLSADPVATAKTGLRFVHFIGLALGLGAATLLDLMLVRFFVRETISSESWKIVHFFSRIVNIGLVVLWVTGIGFIVHYGLFDPAKLMNEKIWAKLAIVLVLSLNGIFIHAIVLPRIKAQIGKTLLAGMSRFQRSAFLISGAISATSWYVPVILGAFPQLNFSVPATTILLTYSLLLVLAIVAMHAVMALIEPSGTGTEGAVQTTGIDDLPVLKWSVKYGYDHGGLDRWQGRSPQARSSNHRSRDRQVAVA